MQFIQFGCDRIWFRFRFVTMQFCGNANLWQSDSVPAPVAIGRSDFRAGEYYRAVFDFLALDHPTQIAQRYRQVPLCD
jgi:hypothetical protein